jgi:hypothetical protein
MSNNGAWQETFWRWLGPVSAALTTFILVRIAVLNIFYTTGDMHDPGWFASVTWHNTWHLHGPPAFHAPFFSEHLAPMLWLTNAVSYVLPLAKFDYYAALIGAIHALYAAGIYRAWQLSDNRVTPVRALIAILVALAAAFSGVAVVALGLPHTELAIPALALWFFIAMARRAYVAAAFWLAACLSAREDAGLHVFLLLMLCAGVLWWRQRSITPDVKWLLRFAVAASGYAVVAFFVKHSYFPSGDVLIRGYLGRPPLRHVTVHFILDRLHFYLIERSYIMLPMLLSFIWAAISRNPLIPLGYVAAFPWLMLSMVAVHTTPGELGYYYGFPFWLSLAWPLIAVRVWHENNQRWPYALMLLASIVGWQWNRVVIFPLEKTPFGDSPFVYHDTLRDRARVDEFTDYYLAHRPLFGLTALDQAVFGLVIDHADRTTWLDPWQSSQSPETVIYFDHSYEWQSHVVPLLRSGLYHCVYAVPETRIRLATRNPLSSDLPTPLPVLLIASLGSGC